ncbi:MAG: multicopper oxidase domain-containing protein [Gemmatimonadetes bacterium]|nr:multicopper oxidase domain-containing protein [Gemmatimonadota bacterium]NNL29577.1 multicopper oxidase domain-containing protein [Gemmatimonadota bacterium]
MTDQTRTDRPVLWGTLAIALIGLAPTASAAQQRPPQAGPPSNPLIEPGELEVAGFESFERSAGTTGADGVHRVALEARQVEWRPWGDDGPALRAHAFVEDGHGARVPGPLIRVPAGTTVEVTLRNNLPRPMAVRGLNDRPGRDPTAANAFAAFGPPITLAPGTERRVRFVASTPGTFHYYGRAPAPNDRIPPPFFGGDGPDGPFVGVMVVDEPAAQASSRERILLITQWVHESVRESQEPFRFMINGRSWPATERLRLTRGQEEHWRIINASGIHHPMHLHGFHFQVVSRGDPWAETVFRPEERRMVVTEDLTLGQTMRISWTPTEPGNWLFHCHLMRHMSGAQHPPSSLDASPSTLEGRAAQMGGLVMGITVEDDEPNDARPVAARALTLWSGSRARAFGDAPALGFVLQDGPQPPPADSIVVPGTPLIIEQGVTTEVTVHNRLDFPLGVHWHGLELQSRYDGVPGWSGPTDSPTPPIAPRDSATVLLAPPRAGTFMYHVHSEPGHELSQGLYGALIVLEEGDRLRDDDVLVVLASVGAERHATPAINGTESPQPLDLQVGREYRLRFMHISPEDQKSVVLSGPNGISEWTPAAEDGADLPASLVRPTAATFDPHVGETYDFVWSPPAAGDYELSVTTQFAVGAPAFATELIPPHTGRWVIRVR